MIKINWMPNVSTTYNKGRDNENNTYYYSARKMLYLCITAGIFGAGRTAEEALEYAKNSQ